MATTDATPVPIKNQRIRLTFPIFDADGDLVTGAASDTPDSQRSIDGATFAACSNEITELATASGMYYLELNASEMNGDTIAVIVKTATAGTKTTPIVMYPTTEDFASLAAQIDSEMVLITADHDLTQSHIADLSTKADSDAVLFTAAISDVKSELVLTHSETTKIVSDLVLTPLSDMVDLIWDEVLTGATHNVVNSAGRRLRQIESIFVLDTGTAQAGAAGSITLAAGASADNNWFDHAMVILTGGTGAGQARAINSYDGGTKVATTVPNWTTNPAGDTEYAILADSEKHVYELHPSAQGDIRTAIGMADSDLDVQLSDIKSELTKTYSDTTLLVTNLAALSTKQDSDMVLLLADHDKTQSDIADLSTKQDSDMVLVATATSDIKSELTKAYSDTTAIEAGGGALTAAQASQLLQLHSDVIATPLSDIYSDTTAIEAGGGSLTAAQASQLLQLHSDVIIIGSDLVIAASDAAAIEALLGIGSGVQDTFTVKDESANLLAAAKVWVTDDAAGTTVLHSGTTNASGVVTMTIPIATGYWVWAYKAGHSFPNYPDEFDVAAGGFAWA